MLRLDGTSEQRHLPSHSVMTDLARILRAPKGLGVVDLRDGRTMFIDLVGLIGGERVNHVATRLYHDAAGLAEPYAIAGDVALARAEDFA